ncbi:hypothetical protein DSLASN_43160 [Desulfoluna limicola]|uniref:Peptidase C39-like domain-containing protein n=1 Tax=Desulfoluna limicola TaxID=2810562 RepID=A0ABM7PMD9_9BACT|nr:C39 family peptidase [Desulfoluna limicola]BCS98684.1 hypothetical protein DSLASN_43160 [Desulfoluna limicola]
MRSFNIVRALILVLVLLGSAGTLLADDVVNLGIPDRAWDSTRPDPSVGWCAEACIQMAMAYYGREVQQHVINRVGDPDHADLYAYEIDDVLDALGVTYRKGNESDQDASEFMAWVRGEIEQGHPVMCGIKIYPDEHPEWFLDHFVLFVGFGRGRFLVNTQLDFDGQQWLSTQQLSSMDTGYSLENSHKRYFGRSITGVR